MIAHEAGRNDVFVHHSEIQAVFVFKQKTAYEIRLSLVGSVLRDLVISNAVEIRIL